MHHKNTFSLRVAMKQMFATIEVFDEPASINDNLKPLKQHSGKFPVHMLRFSLAAQFLTLNSDIWWSHLFSFSVSS